MELYPKKMTDHLIYSLNIKDHSKLDRLLADNLTNSGPLPTESWGKSPKEQLVNILWCAWKCGKTHKFKAVLVQTDEHNLPEVKIEYWVRGSLKGIFYFIIEETEDSISTIHIRDQKTPEFLCPLNEINLKEISNYDLKSLFRSYNSKRATCR